MPSIKIPLNLPLEKGEAQHKKGKLERAKPFQESNFPLSYLGEGD
jgi:hypothetical protein